MATGEEVGNRVLAAIKGFMERRLAQVLEQVKAIETRAVAKAQLGQDVEAWVGGLIAAAVAKLPAPPAAPDLAPYGERLRALEQRELPKGIAETDVLRLIGAALEKLPKPVEVKQPKDGVDGKAGEPGRDALQIEILPSIDPARSYARGTYASHRGGVVRAARTTDYLDDMKPGETVENKGWQIILNGIGDRELEKVGERDFVMRLIDTAGKVMELKFAVPMMIYRGVWREGQYQVGDTVTWAGSLWHCDEATSDKPGIGKGWKLAVKRGADGKDAKS